ncbi:transcriptional regulatory protein DegU [Alicyclobacillus contaminans]|uniref:response regulator n=1 Tax=Alicyclobacillus contaminans TaxID=392016 RepID=UPI00042896AA|nr:response regulator transcription factor [Alicyclobacillus contaminans]GMA51290.1 transcriptional regulatory protein DegU [Alicyclobacillus contaminans]
MTTIRVAIADDHDEFRETLKEVLQFESDIQVVATWRNGEETLRGALEVRPDILMLDINMPQLNGVEVARRLRQDAPDIRIIMLTMHDDENYVLETLKGGAAGYLVKDGGAAEVVRAVREVAVGRAIVHPRVTRTVIAQFQERYLVNDSWRDVLTEREMEILHHLKYGESNEQIAEALHITTKTVRNHVSSILNKLSVTDRTQAVIIALKNKWITMS